MSKQKKDCFSNKVMRALKQLSVDREEIGMESSGIKLYIGRVKKYYPKGTLTRLCLDDTLTLLDTNIAPSGLKASLKLASSELTIDEEQWHSNTERDRLVVVDKDVLVILDAVGLNGLENLIILLQR